ncbi:MAG: hypothetical protein QHH74_05730, partial [Spirochaetota bacterium]|nr:hypothetical protein [Spirochaetota bacterium]
MAYNVTGVCDVLPERTRGGKICRRPRRYSAAAQHAVFYEGGALVSNKAVEDRTSETVYGKIIYSVSLIF